MTESSLTPKYSQGFDASLMIGDPGDHHFFQYCLSFLQLQKVDVASRRNAVPTEIENLEQEMSCVEGVGGPMQHVGFSLVCNHCFKHTQHTTVTAQTFNTLKKRTHRYLSLEYKY